jgi:hypothetical protein
LFRFWYAGLSTWLKAGWQLLHVVNHTFNMLFCCHLLLWCHPRDEIEAEGRSHELEAMVQFIEHTWNVQLTPGHNSSE